MRDSDQREEFIDFWVDYMKSHSDREWSRQQNVLINSVLKTAHQPTREELKEMASASPSR